MPFKIEQDNGEVEVYTKEELDARASEIATEHLATIEATKKEAEDARAEVAKLKNVIADKNENFKSYKDMTEGEKAALSASEVEAIKRADALEAKANALEETYNKDKASAIESMKAKIIREKTAGDADLTARMEENWNMISLEGNDEATLQKRGELAFNMLGLSKPKVNPLHQMMNGMAPAPKGNEFTSTEKGKAAEATVDALLGIKK